jgi:hypothetical protein
VLSRKALLHAASLVAPVLFVLAVIAIAVALLATAQPSFYARFHGFDRRFTNLEQSSHAHISCVECHGRTGAVGLANRVGDFYGSIVGTTAQPALSVFASPSNDACLVCHSTDWADEASRTLQVPHPAHLRVSEEKRECVSCHRWIAHEEAYQAKHKTMPFSGVCAALACHVGPKQTREECGTCHHALAQDQTAWKTEHPIAVRTVGPNACIEACHEPSQCTECHTTGKATGLPSIIPTLGVTVEAMHVKPDWIARHGEEALADPPACASCHISDGECIDCHANRPAFHGPRNTWLNRHKDFAKDENDPGCLTCHQKPTCDSCHEQFRETR